MEIFSDNIFSLAAPGKKTGLKMVEFLGHNSNSPAPGKTISRGKMVSYCPAQNRTLIEQAEVIEMMKKQRDQGSITRLEYSQKRREIMGF